MGVNQRSTAAESSSYPKVDHELRFWRLPKHVFQSNAQIRQSECVVSLINLGHDLRYNNNGRSQVVPYAKHSDMRIFDSSLFYPRCVRNNERHFYGSMMLARFLTIIKSLIRL